MGIKLIGYLLVVWFGSPHVGHAVDHATHMYGEEEPDDIGIPRHPEVLPPEVDRN